jgi:hypothetical protein
MIGGPLVVLPYLLDLTWFLGMQRNKPHCLDLVLRLNIRP